MPVSASPTRADDAARQLNAVNDAFNAGIVAQDQEALLSLYGEEVMWIAPGTAMTLNGRDEAAKLFTFMTGAEAQVTHDIDHLFVSDDETLAVMIGDVVAKAPSMGVDGHGTYLYVLNKNGDDWKIIGDMRNQVAE
ncbi:YybH family protein [Phaeobacter gallaeciensis]|uniref:SnoaL-like domain protein n=1 Tax=Phaeobacter gallaeciensis TaxID=60890 RepID=A0AAD0EC57_9RHOB|nr:nuclear transport factor 2 family protein [Phaeobacter gallaeciensis]AHD08871.1 SnoaL-like domain protein [Phaeobacter gallaeciensis DSM 26640]ATE92137.1 SnoaL-like domain protein [Phaeobacter gallaeciensis]ATE98044.1 SnoaL-like domain protein [Phaeobacter gallaeciensis]ATF00748.1 SnoaL-like domain protein [Phaeobacter gallaeciensis]ATF05179.1 SnoaL-like domain protein [Phaeobacter gallaeciensis]